ncbi:MAG TPA: hypothetical protein VJR29_14470 [bacterium]|nr:hypothetical protein [bacterium]
MHLRSISNGGSPAFAAELRSLEAERDPELKAEGLYHLARRAEARSQYGLAAQLYRRLEGTPLAGRAAERLRVFGGEGSLGDRAEFLLQNFSREAFDPSMLFAMGSAGALFKATRLLTLSRLAASPAATFTRGFAARALASTAGFGVEAVAFPAAGRLAHLALGQPQDWSARALGHDLAASFLVLGGMKLGGFGASSLAQRIGGSQLSPLTRGLFNQSGMFGGILLGQRFEELAGLRQPVSGASSMVDALALLLNFNVAGRLLHGAMGEGFRRWERQVEMQTQALSRPLSNPPLFQRGVGELFGLRIPAWAAVGAGEAPPPPRNFMMMKGEGEFPVRRLPWQLEASLLAMRSRDPRVWEGHLALLENTFLEAKLPPRDYVELYQRLQAVLGYENDHYNRKIAEVLNELLSRIPMSKRGPQQLFNLMIHIDRFPDHSLGDTMASWMRNPGLESDHRRRILQLIEDIFTDQPKDYGEEAMATLSSQWHRLRVEGRHFQRAVRAAFQFVRDWNAWFDPNLDGLNLARMALLDPQTSPHMREVLINNLQSALHNRDLLSAQRMKTLRTLEELAARPDLNDEQQAIFSSRLPMWRNELLRFNLQRIEADPIPHTSELAYLMNQEYVSKAEKRRLAQALQKAFFQAGPESQVYNMIVEDALGYIRNPELSPEMRQTFAIVLLRALNDSASVDLRGVRLLAMQGNQAFLMERLGLLPEEERVGLANRLIDDLGQRGPQAEQAALLLGTLTRMIAPSEALRKRLTQIQSTSQSLDAREVADFILSRWESIN